jgi:hypothetical protein
MAASTPPAASSPGHHDSDVGLSRRIAISHTTPASTAAGPTIRAIRLRLSTSAVVAPTSAAMNGASWET